MFDEPETISYTDLFAALGKFITAKAMQDVCVVEFEDGVIINGSVMYEGREDVQRAQETFVMTREELLRAASTPKRGPSGR